MANVGSRKKQPSVLRVEKETCPAADHQIQNNFSSYHAVEVHSSDDEIDTLLTSQCDELETLTAELDSPSDQPGHEEAMLAREVLRRRCHWFDEKPDAVGAEEKRSAAPSSKHIFGRLRRQYHKFSSSVHNLCEEEPESDSSSGFPSTVPREASPTLVPVCLPPGCVPSDVIVQVPEQATQSKQEALAIVVVDSQSEIDPWIVDLCNQALAAESPAEPGSISVPFSSVSTVIHDLEEDISPGNNLHANALLNKFLQNERVGYRRNAICEELEMNTGFVKINGVKLSLWHLRAELQVMLKKCNL